MMVAEVETEPTFNPRTPTGTFSLRGYPLAGAARHFDLAPDGKRFLMRSARRPVPGAGGLIFVLNWFEELKRLVPTE